jgi:phosphoribosylamine-glycine ligase
MVANVGPIEVFYWGINPYHAAQVVIVKRYQDPVVGNVYIGFNASIAQPDSVLERGHRVLGIFAITATVRDSQGAAYSKIGRIGSSARL